MSILERAPKSREDLWITLPKELVQIIGEYLLAGSSGLRLHACPSPKDDGSNIRYSICKDWMEYGTVYDLMGLEVVFGPQLDILRNNMQLIVSEMDVLETLPGKDWLSNIHFNFYDKASMESWSGETAKFKSLKRISAYCLQYQAGGEAWAKSVHDFLASESPSAKITITSILPSGPATDRYIQQLRRSQRRQQKQTRHDLPSVKTPCIMKLVMPSEHYPHSSCSDDEELYLETGVHGEIMYEEKTELLWFDDKLRQWSERTRRT
ncbi:hypothetical protein BFJ71_g17094 [Fusarium oxysporum]|nr:hypothetical protein BFJ71_g17094 [Fusarium oxysporum]